jgi:hypothetical protein
MRGSEVASQQAHNLKIVGSNPAPATMYEVDAFVLVPSPGVVTEGIPDPAGAMRNLTILSGYAALAQLVRVQL